MNVIIAYELKLDDCLLCKLFEGLLHCQQHQLLLLGPSPLLPTPLDAGEELLHSLLVCCPLPSQGLAGAKEVLTTQLEKEPCRLLTQGRKGLAESYQKGEYRYEQVSVCLSGDLCQECVQLLQQLLGGVRGGGQWVVGQDLGRQLDAKLLHAEER